MVWPLLGIIGGRRKLRLGANVASEGISESAPPLDPGLVRTDLQVRNSASRDHTATTHYSVPSVQIWIFTKSSSMASQRKRRSRSVHSHPSWKNPTNAVSAASYPFMSVEHGRWTSFLISISQALNVGCSRWTVVVFGGPFIPDLNSVAIASTSI